MAGVQKDADRARQGATGTGARYVLGISIAAIVVLFAVVYLFFFGLPGNGPGDLRTESDGTASPVEQFEETPDWREPAPVENPDNPSVP